MNRKSQLLRWLVLPLRLGTALSDYRRPLARVARWLFTSREHTNFTYHLTALNRRYLARFLGVVCGQPAGTMEAYRREILEHARLRAHSARLTRDCERSFLADAEPRYARRIGWYAIVRATRPAVIVETGADKGLGSCVVAAARDFLFFQEQPEDHWYPGGGIGAAYPRRSL